MDSEIYRWLFTAIVAPLAGYIGGGFVAARRAQRIRRQRLAFLCGLPPEQQTVLMEFYVERTHTLRRNPSEPAIRLLMDLGILIRGPGGGTYDAVDRYLTVAPHYWELVDKWARRVIGWRARRALFRQRIHRADQHAPGGPNADTER